MKAVFTRDLTSRDLLKSPTVPSVNTCFFFLFFFFFFGGLEDPSPFRASSSAASFHESLFLPVVIRHVLARALISREALRTLPSE